MSEWNSAEIERVIKESIRRGQTDAEFRALALKDPGMAIMKVAGRPIPEGVKVKFFDGTGAQISIVLPELTAGDELSDTQLEQVAGGGRCAASCAASCGVSSTVSIGLPGVGAIGGCV
jgi:hypothetical protein